MPNRQVIVPLANVQNDNAPVSMRQGEGEGSRFRKVNAEMKHWTAYSVGGWAAMPEVCLLVGAAGLTDVNAHPVHE